MWLELHTLQLIHKGIINRRIPLIQGSQNFFFWGGGNIHQINQHFQLHGLTGSVVGYRILAFRFKSWLEYV